MRRQSLPSLGKIPTTIKELKELLRAEKCENNRKLFFDCTRSGIHQRILIHNIDAQFWIHYFRCGIGLVNLSFFSHLATAESSIYSQTRNVAHSYEYQWFTHDFGATCFKNERNKGSAAKLGTYFIERVNAALINPYSIYCDSRRTKEPYKFVRGSFEKLKQVMTQAYWVCEGLKREKEPKGKTWVSLHVTISCGNLKDAPVFEYSTESFINAVGMLAVRENAPYTVLSEGYGRRVGGECYNWAQKNKHRL